MISQHIGEFIQNYQVVTRVSQHAFTLLPYCRCGLNIRLPVLCFPCKASAHNVKLDAERMQGVIFTIIPLSFNKLRDANGFTVPDGTRCRAEGSSGLSFSVASEDDQNSSHLCRCRDAGINLLFALLLSLAVSVCVGSRFHNGSLMSGRAGCAAMLLLKLAEEIIPFVVNQHKGGQIFDLHHPHRLHAKFGILKTAQAFHELLCQQSRRSADTAEVEATVFMAGIGDLLAAVTFG